MDLNFLISHNNMLYVNNISMLDILMVFSFIFIFALLFIANYYDLTRNIIPNNIVLMLVIYGLVLNTSLSILFNNLYFLLFSLLFGVAVYFISFILWLLKFWAGGDVKIFTAIAFSLSFMSRDFLINFLPNNTILSNYYLSSDILSKLVIFNQFIIYPKIFSIFFNAVLIYFPLIVLILLKRLFEDENLGFDNFTKAGEGLNIKSLVNYFYHLFVYSVFNFKAVLKASTIEKVNIKDLSEGMIIDNYFFNNFEVFKQINRLNQDIYNLSAESQGNRFYLKSKTAGGLTVDDVIFLKVLYNRNMIENPEFQTKITLPFLPSITLGLAVMLLFGDLIFIISKFFSHLFII